MITPSLKTTARNSVLYVDRGVIVISKSPGIISQASAAKSAKHNDPASLFSLTECSRSRTILTKYLMKLIQHRIDVLFYSAMARNR